MKNRSREYVHDRLYELASKMLKRYNPCAECFATNCYRQHATERCCEGCPYFKNGCTVEALYCKLWLCRSVKLKGNTTFIAKRLHTLERIARDYDLLLARATRKETLEFGEALSGDQWWLYYRDLLGFSRRSSHLLLRSGLNRNGVI